MSQKQKLSLLWIFLFLNFIFCDVFSLMYPPMIQQMAAGTSIDGIEMTQGFLLAFAVVMELGMVMVVASRLLPHGPNRLANIVIGLGLLVVQVGSLFSGGNTLHYIFFSVVEVATLLWIVWIALRWRAAA
jgi:hypothetical protein